MRLGLGWNTTPVVVLTGKASCCEDGEKRRADCRATRHGRERRGVREDHTSQQGRQFGESLSVAGITFKGWLVV